MVTDDIYAQLLLAVAAREGPSVPASAQRIPEHINGANQRAVWLLNQLYRHHPESDLGLRYGHHLHPAALCDVARALCSAPTLGQTMGLVSKLAFARSQAFSLVSVQDQEHVHLFLSFPHQPSLTPSIERFCIEAAFSFAVHALIYSLGELPEKFSVALPYAPPPYHSLYARAWQTHPHWQAPIARLSFAARSLEWPLRTCDEALFAVSVERARQRWIPSSRRLRACYRIAEAMLRHHPYLFHVDAMARHLNMSVRTLQKQLSHEEDSFQAIRYRVRRVLHAIYADSLNWSIAETSEKLGFESLSGYRRFTRKLAQRSRSSGTSTSSIHPGSSVGHG